MLLPLIALIASTTPVSAVHPAEPVFAADTTTWIVDNHGRRAGDLVVITRGDTVISRYIYTDRNRGGRVETRHVMRSGRVVSAESRPVLADGTAGAPTERIEIIGDSIRTYFANGNSSIAAVPAGAFVGLRNATPMDQAALARHLIAQANRTSAVAGGGSARAEIIADTTFRLGATRQRARLVMVYRGTSNSPSGVWLDDRGALLATDIQWFITIRPGLEPLMPAMRAIELKWRDAQAEALAKRLVTATSGTIAITGGNLFDSEAGVMRPAQTILIRGDRIIAVGAADAVTIPAGATVIDAAGKTVMPGMWDMHGHIQVASQAQLGAIQLANGLTTVRDMAADMDVAVSLRDREARGLLASPRAVLSGFIEGPLAWAGPSEATAATEAEARRWVERYAAAGYRQIKLYNVLHPDIVPTIAAEARKRGMRLSGHIPRGMSIEAAVGLGFDEINHAAFLFSNFYQDSLYLPRMRAYSQVATAVAPTIDVFSPQMTKLLEYLKAHGTAVDGTFNLWIGGGGASVGAGGSPDQAKADSAYLNLIRRLYAMGIPLIAGTDNVTGSTFRRELEMYELAGIPAARVLQIATIDAARIMKDERDYGSVSVGKVADLLIVGGNPTQRISELQRIETVIRGGRLYKVSELTTAGTRSVNGAEGSDHDH